jgi:predicted oxidoreductase
VHQPEFSPLCLGPLRDGVLDQCLERDVTPLAWSPFARGRLGLSLEAARCEPEGERLAAVLENLDILAEREGVSRAAVVLAWILVHPSRPVPIIGTQRLDRIRASADAFKVHLTRRDWYAVLEAAQGEKLP